MEIQSIMKYHITPVRMATVKAPQAVSCGEGVDKSELASTEVEDGTW